MPDPEAKGGWRYVTKATKAEIEAEAEKWLEQQPTGFVFMMLPPARRRFLEAIHRNATAHDEEALLAFLESRKQSADLADSISRYLDHKAAAKGEKTRHLYNVGLVLKKLAARMPGKLVSDVQPSEVEAFWKAQTEEKSRKTANHVRGALVGFWLWAQVNNLAAAGTTPPQKLPSFKLAGVEPTFYRPEEFLFLASQIRPEYRAWLVLGGIAGLRPEEASATTKKNSKRAEKRGPAGEDIDWKFGVIRVARESSKVRFARNVTLTDGLRAWLEWAGVKEGFTGPVCPRNPSERGQSRKSNIDFC